MCDCRELGMCSRVHWGRSVASIRFVEMKNLGKLFDLELKGHSGWISFEILLCQKLPFELSEQRGVNWI